MSKNTETEDRLTAEWEPEVKIRSDGFKNRNLRRKVITTGIVRRKCDGTLAWVAEQMRKGKEVRLTLEGKDALRFVPITDKDFETIGLKAQTMGDFLNKLRDLTIKLFKRNGKRVEKSAAVEENQEHVDESNKYHEVIQSISPDMMVTCPECGTQFRVGKSLK